MRVWQKVADSKLQLFLTMAKHRFKITPFTNKTGSKSFRVSGTLDGKSIRKNFKSRDDAVEYRQKLDIKFLETESEGQTVWTTLTHDQNREAIAAAVEEYTNEKTKEFERGLISRRQERAIGIEMGKFSGYFEERVVGEIQADEIREYLDAPLGRSKAVPTLKTWNNRRGYLSTFFKYCLSKKYVAEDVRLHLPLDSSAKRRTTSQCAKQRPVGSASEGLDQWHFCLLRGHSILPRYFKFMTDLSETFPKCVGLFPNAFAQEPDEQPSLGKLLERIRSDEWKEPIRLLRKRLDKGSRQKYDESKRSLPAFPKQCHE